jgi:hypothetical protein
LDEICASSPTAVKQEGLRWSVSMGQDRRQRRRRIAAIGGAVVAAKKHRDANEAQQQEAAAQQAAPAEPGQAGAPGGLTAEAMGQLKQLGQLHDQNVLTDEEFEREKAKLLSP